MFAIFFHLFINNFVKFNRKNATVTVTTVTNF